MCGGVQRESSLASYSAHPILFCAQETLVIIARENTDLRTSSDRLQQSAQAKRSVVDNEKITSTVVVRNGRR